MKILVLSGTHYDVAIGRDELSYVEEKTGHNAIPDERGDNAPYNGEPEYCINTDKAEKLGFRFSNLRDWIYELLDYCMELVRENEN